jgi:hypothetical protein
MSNHSFLFQTSATFYANKWEGRKRRCKSEDLPKYNYSTRLSGKRVGVNQILLGSICYTFSFALSKKLMF